VKKLWSVLHRFLSVSQSAQHLSNFIQVMLLIERTAKACRIIVR